jgi:hypothetical protein
LRLEEIVTFLDDVQERTSHGQEPFNITRCLDRSVITSLKQLALQEELKGHNGLIGIDGRPILNNDEIMHLISLYIRPTSKEACVRIFEKFEFPNLPKNVGPGKLTSYPEFYRYILEYLDGYEKRLDIMFSQGEGKKCYAGHVLRGDNRRKSLITLCMNKIPGSIGTTILEEFEEELLERYAIFSDFKSDVERKFGEYLAIFKEVSSHRKIFGVEEDEVEDRGETQNTSSTTAHRHFTRSSSYQGSRSGRGGFNSGGNNRGGYSTLSNVNDDNEEDNYDYLYDDPAHLEATLEETEECEEVCIRRRSKSLQTATKQVRSKRIKCHECYSS